MKVDSPLFLEVTLKECYDECPKICTNVFFSLFLVLLRKWVSDVKVTDAVLLFLVAVELRLSKILNMSRITRALIITIIIIIICIH